MAGNNNTSRAVQTVLTVLLVLGGVWATSQMQQRQMESLYNMQQFQIDHLQKSVDGHILKDGHPIYHTAELADLRERLERIETRANEEIRRIRQWQETHDEMYPPKWLVDRVKDLEDWQKYCMRGKE